MPARLSNRLKHIMKDFGTGQVMRPRTGREASIRSNAAGDGRRRSPARARHPQPRVKLVELPAFWPSPLRPTLRPDIPADTILKHNTIAIVADQHRQDRTGQATCRGINPGWATRRCHSQAPAATRPATRLRARHPHRLLWLAPQLGSL
jgi:hypothetical protein